MALNCSLLTLPRPLGTPTLPDFDICDRRYGMNLDIPRCDVAASRLDAGSASTTYQISDQEGPHVLPRSIDYGGCAISIEVAGPPNPHQTYTLVPDAVRSLASHLINECVGRAGGRSGGFATMDLGRLIDFVVDPCADLDQYPSSSAFLTVSVTGSNFKNPSPGNYDPIIAQTLADATRDAAMRVPASGQVRRTLMQRFQAFYRRAMTMSTGGSKYAWWGNT
ncbi:MAG: hypothetical protein Q9169_003884 [Polycauliona sp. 2 TL-2023]